MENLSPCGRGRPKGAGEGYLGTTEMLKKFQKALRTNQTDAERHLWYLLRSRRFQRWKFRRQHILQGYIVDFVCLERKLVIELDGGSIQIEKPMIISAHGLLKRMASKLYVFGITTY